MIVGEESPPRAQAWLAPTSDTRTVTSGLGPLKAVRPMIHGPLEVTGATVVVPGIAEIDRLVID